MTAWDMIRTAAYGPLHPAWEEAYPSLEKHGLTKLTDDDEPFMRLDTGHRIHLAASGEDPTSWMLHVTHRHDIDSSEFGIPGRVVRAYLGTQNEGVGDRLMKALGHPEVMKGMRRLMTPPQPGEYWSHDVDARGGR